VPVEEHAPQQAVTACAAQVRARARERAHVCLGVQLLYDDDARVVRQQRKGSRALSCRLLICLRVGTYQIRVVTAPLLGNRGRWLCSGNGDDCGGGGGSLGGVSHAQAAALALAFARAVSILLLRPLAWASLFRRALIVNCSTLFLIICIALLVSLDAEHGELALQRLRFGRR
jgi:hypothetical protein